MKKINSFFKYSIMKVWSHTYSAYQEKMPTYVVLDKIKIISLTSYKWYTNLNSEIPKFRLWTWCSSEVLREPAGANIILFSQVAKYFTKKFRQNLNVPLLRFFKIFTKGVLIILVNNRNEQISIGAPFIPKLDWTASCSSRLLWGQNWIPILLNITFKILNESILGVIPA